jgi:hypothetical protein
MIKILNVIIARKEFEVDESNIEHIIETVKDRQPDVAEEIVSALTFPGVDFIFQISREETWEGEWIFRVYNFTLTAFDEISELKYMHLRELMMNAFTSYNDGDMLSLKVKIDEMMDYWKLQEFKIKTAYRSQKDGVNLKPQKDGVNIKL